MTILIDYTTLTTSFKADIKKLHQTGIITRYSIEKEGQLKVTVLNAQSILDVGVLISKHPETNFLYDHILK